MKSSATGLSVRFLSVMIPVRRLMIDASLYDTRWALVVFQISFQTGFCTLFMRNFIRQVPDAYLDVARLEGLSEFAILCRVVLPLVRPARFGVWR